jgi:hypothetical protein
MLSEINFKVFRKLLRKSKLNASGIEIDSSFENPVSHG